MQALGAKTAGDAGTAPVTPAAACDSPAVEVTR
jgi:hypothetical protein